MNADQEADTQLISLEYELPHPPKMVWRALSEPDILAEWLMSTDMHPVAGQAFRFQSDPTPSWDGVVHCEVLQIDPPTSLQYSWKAGPEASRLDTTVTWTLTLSPSGGTLLLLEHYGFQPAHTSAFNGAKEGWERMVGELREVLARTA